MRYQELTNQEFQDFVDNVLLLEKGTELSSSQIQEGAEFLTNEGGTMWLPQIKKLVTFLPEFFNISDLYLFVPIFEKIWPENKHVKDKLRQALQNVAADGELIFTTKGNYRRVLGVVEDFEDEKGPVVYLVSQNNSGEIERWFRFMWSPKLDKSGHNNAGYLAMAQVRKGDIILNAERGYIKAVSVAKEDAYSADRPTYDGFPQDSWNDDGWRVDLDSETVDFKFNDFQNTLKDISGGPFNKNGELKEQYLTKLTIEQQDFFRERIPQLRGLFPEDKAPMVQPINLENFVLTEVDEVPLTAFDKKLVIGKVADDYGVATRQTNGKLGEFLVLRYLVKQFPDATIRGVSKNLDPVNGDDRLGYDIKVEFKSGEVILVDSKATSGRSGFFYLSENERVTSEQALNNENLSYLIYYVTELDKVKQTGKLTVRKIEDVELVPISYRAFVTKSDTHAM
jgi:hypothetical protein